MAKKQRIIDLGRVPIVVIDQRDAKAIGAWVEAAALRRLGLAPAKA